MAIQHRSTKLCDYLIQAIDGRFTLAGIFVNLFCTDFPLVRPIGVLVDFTGEPGDQFAITLEGPPESFVKFTLAEGTLDKPALRHPLEQWTASIGGTVGVRFPEEAIYKVVLSSGDTVVHEQPFATLIYKPDEFNSSEQLPDH